MTNGKCVINGVNYDISELGEEAQKTLHYLNFLDKDIDNLQLLIAINKSTLALLKNKVRRQILADKSGMEY